MQSYEYAVIATVFDDEGKRDIVIPLSNAGEETGKALAEQYMNDTGFEKANPNRFIQGYRVVRRTVGEWEEYKGEG